MASGGMSEKAAGLVEQERVFATVATVLPDGSPHLAVVWIGRDGDQLVFATAPGSRKARNLRRDPRVTLMLNPASAPYTYAEVRGTASLEEGGGELLDQLSLRYEGKRYAEFTGGAGGEGAILVRVTPERVVDLL